jgi:hypothetical protein
MNTLIDWFVRGWDNFIARTSGPLHFRFFFQPAMAALLAILAGIRDARAGRPAFLREVFFNTAGRRDLVLSGWKDVGRVFFLAVALDLIYQLAVHRGLYPLELVFTAVILALVPYFVLRGPANRIARLFVRRESPADPGTPTRLTAGRPPEIPRS